MNNADLLHARVAEANANFPGSQFRCVDPSSPPDDFHFSCQTEATRPFNDAEREQAIARAGRAVIAAMGRKEVARRRYLESSCLTDKADMDAADMKAREFLRVMEGLIKGRSAAQVARMEIERGLA